MSAHVDTVCRAAYFQLRQIGLSTLYRCRKTLDQAFISCRLDYCNSLSCGITDNLIQHLPLVQPLCSLQAPGVVTTSLLFSDEFIGC